MAVAGWVRFPGRTGSRVILKGDAIGWPAHSPDLTPLDFYLWGYLESRVYTQRLQELNQLKTTITNAIGRNPSAACVRVAEDAKRRAIPCACKNLSHIEYVLR